MALTAEPDVPDGYKRCQSCREVKPLSDFHKNRSMRDGLQHYCKECMKDAISKKKECVICGKTFYGRAITCSNACTHERVSRTKRMAAGLDVDAIPNGFKHCPRCRGVKPKTDFTNNNRTRDGLQTYCSQCAADIARNHGIKNRTCVICGKEYSGKGKTCSDQCRRNLVSRTKKKATLKKAGVSHVPEGHKCCSRCLVIKPTSEFAVGSKYMDGLQPRCRDCSKKLSTHCGICEVCGAEFEGYGKTCSNTCAGVLVSKTKIANAKEARSHLPDGHKQCNSCGEVKPLDEFSKSSRSWDGHFDRCGACVHAYYEGNRERISEYQKQYRERYPQKVRERNKRYQPTANAKAARRYKTDPTFRLSRIMASAINQCLKNGKEWRSWKTMVPYSVDELKAHLEAQFKDGMSWENQGRGGWHIDHIRPISTFTFESFDDPEFQECWALENLQPLPEFDNLSKGGTWNPDED